jgi:hypothetical protein
MVRAPASPGREESVPEGRPGQHGRTDCVIRFGQSRTAIVLIEAKLTGVKDADLGGLSGYRKWLDGEDMAFREFLLLVRAREGSETCDELRFIDDVVEWRSLCINLRRLLPEIRKRRGTVVAVCYPPRSWAR